MEDHGLLGLGDQGDSGSRCVFVDDWYTHEVVVIAVPGWQASAKALVTTSVRVTSSTSIRTSSRPVTTTPVSLKGNRDLIVVGHCGGSQHSEYCWSEFSFPEVLLANLHILKLSSVKSHLLVPSLVMLLGLNPAHP